MKIGPLTPDPEVSCPVTYCLSMIGGKWKPVILYCLANDIQRFGALQRAIPAVTKQMLTKQLRELEQDGIISRTVFTQVPPRVDYALTQKGESLMPVISMMKQWGQTQLDDLAAIDSQ